MSRADRLDRVEGDGGAADRFSKPIMTPLQTKGMEPGPIDFRSLLNLDWPLVSVNRVNRGSTLWPDVQTVAAIEVIANLS